MTLLCARHCSEHFTSNNPFSLHNSPKRWVLSPFYRRGHEGTERLSNLLKVTQSEVVEPGLDSGEHLVLESVLC